MKVILRAVTEDDYELILKWRNDPDLMKTTYSQKDGHIITLEEHLAWLKTGNKERQIYIIWAGEETLQRVGVVTNSHLDSDEPETGIYIGDKSFLGKSVAHEASRQQHDILRSQGYKYTIVTILDNNPHAVRFAKAQGFVRIGEAKPGLSVYRLKL